MVGFRITFAERRALEPGERVSIVLDSDHRKGTGNPYLAGADMLLSYGTVGEHPFAGEFLRWNGNRWELASTDRRTVKFLISRGVLEVVLARDLLRGRGFNWTAVTFQAGTGRGTDLAPDGGTGSFALSGSAAPGRGAAPKRACVASRPA